MMAKWMMGVQVIDPNTNDPEARELVRMVHGFAARAGLPAMPEVGVYESADVNAFATGPSKSRSLVAVSTGLLHQMNRTETEGVIAHEVAHIANGDMVTMTLIQGVMNTFVVFLSRVIGYAVVLIMFLYRGEVSDYCLLATSVIGHVLGYLMASRTHGDEYRHGAIYEMRRLIGIVAGVQAIGSLVAAMTIAGVPPGSGSQARSEQSNGGLPMKHYAMSTRTISDAINTSGLLVVAQWELKRNVVSIVVDLIIISLKKCANNALLYILRKREWKNMKKMEKVFKI